ncbi:CoA-disulfide reductase [Selenomonadales bacterium OttesenSCG-928-I06]|nr:CoA-disulfide reductase [Selenomonadales bacterium OttesenSCG-928-I06]
MKVVIIGGVATGMSAAAKFKRSVKEAEVIVFEKGSDVSYAACGLPYYVSGTTPELDQLRMRSIEKFAEQGIDVYIKHEVLSVNPEKKMVVVLDLQNDEKFCQYYDKLVIATGAVSQKLKVPGADLKNVFTLRSLRDGAVLRKAVSDEKIQEVAIVGGGFIGLEMAEAFLLAGKNVRLFARSKTVLRKYEPEIAEVIEKRLADSGVMLQTEESPVEFVGDEFVQEVVTNKGRYKADLVLLSVGIVPNTEFVKDIGLEFLSNGAIVVNKKMETNLPDIYAGGDCASVYHKILGKDVYVPLGTNANKQGKLIGEVLAGSDKEFGGVLGTSVFKFMDLECGETGMSEAEAREAGFEVGTSVIDASTHAHYYPGHEPIRIKLVYDVKTRRVLGASMAGGAGTALRVSVMVPVIDAGMTIEEVGALDLGYAPPFSSAWDPIHIAANAAEK